MIINDIESDEVGTKVGLDQLGLLRGGRNRIGRREKWPKQSWEEGEIGRKSREEGEKEKLGVGRIELDGPG